MLFQPNTNHKQRQRYFNSTINIKEGNQLNHSLTHRSSLAFTSKENTELIGVIAWTAVFSDISRAPAIIVVSSCVNSPPLPACQKEMRLISSSTGLLLNPRFLLYKDASDRMSIRVRTILFSSNVYLPHSHEMQPKFWVQHVEIELFPQVQEHNPATAPVCTRTAEECEKNLLLR